jgi:hypothetical protein
MRMASPRGAAARLLRAAGLLVAVLARHLPRILRILVSEVPGERSHDTVVDLKVLKADMRPSTDLVLNDMRFGETVRSGSSAR